MQVTLWGEYGIHCCTLLGDAYPGHMGAASIAEALGIDVDYSYQILHRLRQAGLVESRRGARGGYGLTRSPSRISVWDVLMATQGETFRMVCDAKPIQNGCGGYVPCGLQKVWAEVRSAIDDVVKNHSIASLQGRTVVAGDAMVARDALVQIQGVRNGGVASYHRRDEHEG